MGGYHTAIKIKMLLELSSRLYLLISTVRNGRLSAMGPGGAWMTPTGTGPALAELPTLGGDGLKQATTCKPRQPGATVEKG